MVAVPDVASLTFARGAGDASPRSPLDAVQKDVFDLDVAAGTVDRHRTRRGLRGRQGLHGDRPGLAGPAGPCRSPALGGMTDDRGARHPAGARRSQVGDDRGVLHGCRGDSVVVGIASPRARAASRIDCTTAAPLHEGDSATLSVSLGPVPDVTGESVGGATATLDGMRPRRSPATSRRRRATPSTRVRSSASIEREGGGGWQPGRHRDARRLDRSAAVPGAEHRRA